MRWVAAAVALLLLAPAAAAGGLYERLDLTGSLRGGFWSSTRALDDATGIGAGSLWLKSAPDLGASASLHLDGWLGRLRADGGLDGRLREAYLAAAAGAVDLRIGRQIIVWGRADRINPTDVLGARDFTLLVPDDDDQRLGTFAARASYYLGAVALTGIWMPFFTPDTVPLPAPLAYHDDRPHDVLSQGAVRIEQTGGVVDWSLSYFRGFDRLPDLALDLPAARLRLAYHRVHVIGMDGAATLGRFGARAEAAYTITEDKAGDQAAVKNANLFLVAGGDRTFFEYLNLNLQYLLRAVVDYEDPDALADPAQRAAAIQAAIVSNQLDRLQQGLTLRVSDQWLHETLQAEVAAILLFPRRDYSIRPKLRYAVTDRASVVVGGDLFRGRERSLFGFLEDNSSVFAELRFGF